MYKRHDAPKCSGESFEKALVADRLMDSFSSAKARRDLCSLSEPDIVVPENTFGCMGICYVIITSRPFVIIIQSLLVTASRQLVDERPSLSGRSQRVEAPHFIHNKIIWLPGTTFKKLATMEGR